MATNTDWNAFRCHALTALGISSPKKLFGYARKARPAPPFNILNREVFNHELVFTKFDPVAKFQSQREFQRDEEWASKYGNEISDYHNKTALEFEMSKFILKFCEKKRQRWLKFCKFGEKKDLRKLAGPQPGPILRADFIAAHERKFAEIVIALPVFLFCWFWGHCQFFLGPVFRKKKWVTFLAKINPIRRMTNKLATLILLNNG